MKLGFLCVIIASLVCSTCGDAKYFEISEDVHIEFPPSDRRGVSDAEGSNDVAAGAENGDVNGSGFFQGALRSILNPIADQALNAVNDDVVRRRGKAASKKILQKALWESQSWLEDTLSGVELRKMTQLFGVHDLLPVPRIPGTADNNDGANDDGDLKMKQKGYRGDTDKPTPVMIADAGYPVEIHETQTEDGYILQMHRIPHGIANGSGPGEGPKTPIYLQHGLLCSSADWVISGPGKGLAYLLADKGYDIWMGNIRGNTYSKRHETLSPKDAAFWDFSWDQHALYDVPAQMDLITSVTGKERMFYIGHSMGTTMFWAMCNVMPHYASRIKAMFALAPVARVDHMKSPVALLAPFVSEIKLLLKIFGEHSFLPHGYWLTFFGKYVCLMNSLDKRLCENGLFLLCGYDSMNLNVQDIVGPLGYPLETHRCQTVDGYILELHRIPHGRDEQLSEKENLNLMDEDQVFAKGPGDQRKPVLDKSKPRPPILMMHGLLASSAVYVISGSHPENAIGFMFADHGYDVWLGNFRGNDFSREHVSLSPNDAEYWNFSWDEMGRFDLPAIINYISETTGAEKMKYVGHSMGTTTFWVMSHYDAEPQAFGITNLDQKSAGDIIQTPGSMMSKISMMIALAPVGRLDHMQSPMRYLCGWTNDINAAMEAVGVRGFLPSSHPAVQFVAASLLDNMNPTVVKYVVKNSHLILSGEDFHFDEPMVTQMLKFFPAGMSARTLAHFGQICSAGRLQQPDFGSPPQNIQAYGSPLPPLYDLSRVSVPVALFSGQKDRFTNVEDVKWLSEQIPNVIAAEVLKGFGHLDFHWGYKVRSVLFPKMLEAIASEKRKEFGCGGREDPSRQG